MALLIILLVLSVVLNAFLFWQCAKYGFFGDDSGSSTSDDEYRRNVRAEAHNCKKQLEIIASNMKKEQET